MVRLDDLEGLFQLKLFYDFLEMSFGAVKKWKDVRPRYCEWLNTRYPPDSPDYGSEVLKGNITGCVLLSEKLQLLFWMF